MTSFIFYDNQQFVIRVIWTFQFHYYEMKHKIVNNTAGYR
jgi:hypothetical protein